MTEPRRHDATPRNRRKALRHVRNLREELEFIRAQLTRIGVSVEYSIGRTCRLENRLTAEVEADKKCAEEAS